MNNEININLLIKKLHDIRLNPRETWAMYGTGRGAELLYAALKSVSLENVIKYVIERDDKVYEGERFHGILIKKLADVDDLLDGIIIAAINYNTIIKERVLTNLTEDQLEHIRVIDIFRYNTMQGKQEYLEYIERSILKENMEFVKFDGKEYQAKEDDTKIITWYLPQYHQMEINNKFHGQGFTEWTNTSRAIPMFKDHYQPHIPYDVGYYDLSNLDTLKRQIYLAKHYGVYGFCFHYYWFSGKKIMEKPLELLLKHKELDMPFCIDWATENWTALWDGGSKEIIMEQKLQDEDDWKFMEDILPYMKDSRYIKIDGRPVLVIYRVILFGKERTKLLLDNFRNIAKRNGFSDLYIMFTTAFRFREDVREWGGDALVEFPPHMLSSCMDKYEVLDYLNPHFNGSVLDAGTFVKEKKYMINYGKQRYFRSALTSWDSTARKAISGAFVLQGLNPYTFKEWLTDIVIESRSIHSKSENIVFINSWNEWGEGSHLEPDMKYGYAYLQSIKEVLENQGR